MSFLSYLHSPCPLAALSQTSIVFPFRAFTLGRTLSVRLLTILVLNLISRTCLAKLHFMCTACPMSRCHRWPRILVCLLGAFFVSPGVTCRDYENGTLSFIYIFIPVVCEYLASIWLSTCTINQYRTPIDSLRAVYLYFVCVCVPCSGPMLPQRLEGAEVQE